MFSFLQLRKARLEECEQQAEFSHVGCGRGPVCTWAWEGHVGHCSYTFWPGSRPFCYGTLMGVGSTKAGGAGENCTH